MAELQKIPMDGIHEGFAANDVVHVMPGQSQDEAIAAKIAEIKALYSVKLPDGSYDVREHHGRDPRTGELLVGLTWLPKQAD